MRRLHLQAQLDFMHIVSLASPALRAAAPAALRAAACVALRVPAVRMMSEEDGTGSDEMKQEQESLYTTPSFELDATTVLALLGGAIAFNFFVLANL